jgi:hypothetical protein
MYRDVDISPELLSFITKGEMGEDDLHDIVLCMDDVNQHHDDELFFLIGYQYNAVELFGCPSGEGLMALAVYYRTFSLTTPSVVFHGIIQNPKELPYEIDGDDQALILFADHKYQMFYRMANVVEYIETCLREYSASTIEDFAVVIGKELDFDNHEWNNVVAGGLTSYGWLH